jgi:hypothetical protein
MAGRLAGGSEGPDIGPSLQFPFCLPQSASFADHVGYNVEMRFRLRTLLIVVFVVAVLLTGVRWWFQPYSLTGSYPNGVRAWEQWHRRTLRYGLHHIATIRYYPNGQKAYEIYRSDDVKRYWSRAGEAIDQVTFYQQRDIGELLEFSRDPQSDFPWPYNGHEGE